MNIVIGLLIAAILLSFVRPVKAGSQLFVKNFIPAVINNSFDFSFSQEMFVNKVKMFAVDGSEIRAEAHLTNIRKNRDTRIAVKTSGLEPGGQYIAVYYRNDKCEKEINSVEKSINGAFFADESGNGDSEGVVKDSFERIGSVSIRRAENFKLVACGTV